MVNIILSCLHLFHIRVDFVLSCYWIFTKTKGNIRLLYFVYPQAVINIWSSSDLSTISTMILNSFETKTVPSMTFLTQVRYFYRLIGQFL